MARAAKAGACPAKTEQGSKKTPRRVRRAELRFKFKVKSFKLKTTIVSLKHFDF